MIHGIGTWKWTGADRRGASVGGHEAWCTLVQVHGSAGRGEGEGESERIAADTGEGRHRLIGTHHACLVAVASPFPIPRHVQYGADCSGMPEQSRTYHQYCTGSVASPGYPHCLCLLL
jgi:hypothetical protein